MTKQGEPLRVPGPGVYPELRDRYFDLVGPEGEPLASSTWLRNASLKSPRHAAWDAANDKPTPAKRLGTLQHLATLEPLTYATVATIEPDPAKVAPDAQSPRATKAYKEARAKLEASGKVVLTAKEADGIVGMARGLRSIPEIETRLEHPETVTELPIVWREPMTGVLCKAKIDALARAAEFREIVDLKTSRDASDWRRTVQYDLLHVQAALYFDGARALADELGVEVELFSWAVIENVPPYVGKYAPFPDSEGLEAGRILYREALHDFAEGLAKKRWRGYRVEEVYLPEGYVRAMGVEGVA